MEANAYATSDKYDDTVYLQDYSCPTYVVANSVTHDVSSVSESRKYAESSCRTIILGVVSRVVFASNCAPSEGS
jgi:hypothetical protein